MDSLITGALIANYLRQNNIKEYLISKLKYIYYLFYLIIFIIITLIITDLALIEYIKKSAIYILLDLVFGLFLILPILDKNGILGRILRNKILQLIGLVSYGIYIYHFIVLGIVFKIVLNQRPNIASFQELLVTILAVIVTIGVSLLSYYYFEKLFLKLSSKFKYSS
jgi:peptidoglycan/LPS O-acetylase OafA/YrhL